MDNPNKPGDLLLCVRYHPYVTVGKVYEVLWVDEYYSYIIVDKGNEDGWNKNSSMFINLRLLMEEE